MPGFLREIELRREKVKDWNKYPFSIPAISNLSRLEFDTHVTILVGENGSGKSTLIEAIAVKAGFNPEGGSKNFQSANRPSESVLRDFITLVRSTRRERTGFFLRAETMFNVFTEAEEEGYQEYGWGDLHEQSHGEAFMWVALNRFNSGGLYILDEPEAALSPQRQLAFLKRMKDLVDDGCQFIISTHSPILMAYPKARIYSLNEEGIVQVKYEETEHYIVTRAFLQNPTGVLSKLFAEED